MPEPKESWFPTVNIATAIGWRGDEKPEPAPPFAVAAYAKGLDHPRWLAVLPNGDVLVAETNAPEQPEEEGGLGGWLLQLVLTQVGSGRPSANRITLLRGVKEDGSAELQTVFLDGLNAPFGMALVNEGLYVANTDAVLRFPYKDGQTRIEAAGEKVADLPAGPLNHHWTKNIIASPDGSRLYVTVGSNSNIGENGLDKEVRRAAILEIDPSSSASRVFASGLRNPNGMAWHPDTEALWTVVNERDGLGSDLVPDYLTSVKEGGFYGWPFSYFGQHLDRRVSPQDPGLVAKAIVPDYALGNHTAALGLAFSAGTFLPERYRSGAFVGLHGSWNRKPKSGYKVIFLPFAGGHPSGPPLDVLTGFLDKDENARGRPVGVAIDSHGALLIADDVGNAVWRVTPAEKKTAGR